MKTTVIVPTYQGENKISACLNAIKSQTNQDFELVVVIDGSTDGTRDIMKEFKKDFQNLIIIYQPNGGRAHARNSGVKMANGELLIFIDDDIHLDKNAISGHKSHHETTPNTMVSGAVPTSPALPKSDVIEYKIKLEQKWNRSLPDQSDRLKTPYITAANFSISKTLFDQLGGFNEKLTDCEDYYLAINAFEQNIGVYYDQQIIGYHYDPITMESYIKRKRAYAASMESLQQIDPELLKKYPLRNSKKTKGIKKKIYNVISSPKWVKRIDNNTSLIRFLPKKLRYKIYDHIIQGLAVYYPNRKLS